MCTLPMKLLAVVVSLLLSIILVDYASCETELMPMASSGSGSGMVIMPVDSPMCIATSLRLDVTIFDAIVDTLMQLECTVEEGYEVLFVSSEIGLNVLESDNMAVFGDYFDYSSEVQTFSVEVCTYSVLTAVGDPCSEEFEVSAIIHRHSDRLLPFGMAFSDDIIRNADDRSKGVFLANPIPFWGSYYNSVYLSTNGVLSFGRPFTQFCPIVFPYGWSTVPVIAPYWNDLDFRNGLEGSGLYYTTYVSSGSKRDEAFLQEFAARLYDYTEGKSTNFKPRWMLVATWYKATPYYGRYNKDEILIFQLLLATDSVDTYTIFLYEADGINWDRDSRQIVIGYDSKNYIDYLNVEDSENFIVIDSIVGNTGNAGEWYFYLTDPDSDLDHKQECFKWVARQEENVVEEYFEGLPSCPCTRFQARRDWRFWFGWRWGLSSGPNCATLVWSRRQSTIECCYDDSGALLVGGKSGGSYKLHHPWFSSREYITEDKQPYEHCCQFSNFCSIFYTYRPSNDCSGYNPSRISFTWGDPHFQTVDGLTYTFNGYGEYILLESEENDLGVQVRLALLNSTFNATVISAVAVVQGGIQPVQVEESEGDVIVYVNGSAIELSAEDDQNKIVTEDTTYNSFDEFVASEQNFSMAEYISLRFSDDDLIITTSTGASVMVSSSSSVLHLAVEVNDDFVNATAGLLGYFNANDSDDFYTPHGEILPSNSSERDLFSYGKLWHVDVVDSLFEYFDGKTYLDYNDGWDTHSPAFTDELDRPDDTETVCGDDTQCIFDYAVTGNVSFAIATHATTVNNQETQDILNNNAPVINGAMEVYVTAGQPFMGNYYISDEDGHAITTIDLKAPQPDGITLDTNENMTSLIWDNPGNDLPSSAIQILVNDSMGAVTLRNISVILCACENNGTCINATSPQYNSHGHYRQPCDCPESFSGDLCEIDDRNCSDTSCPESAMCVVNTSVAAGFTCSQCQDGYELADDGKCTDINECTTTNPEYEDNCTHECSNTEGSYMCLCRDGYELSDDGTTCNDFDECYEGTDSCPSDQRCNNTEGGFECSCYSPGRLTAEGDCAHVVCTSCDTDLCADIGGNQGICLCLKLGTYCVGDCEGDLQALQDGTQNCNECEPNMYGYRCRDTCDCVHGTCDPVSGCECNVGYEGLHCDSEINEATPEFAEDTILVLTLSWNLPNSAVLAQFNATDSDVGMPGEVTFSLSHEFLLPTDVSSGENIFSINNETGILSLVKDLNITRGLYTRFVLAVVASDLGVNPLSSEVLVSVVLEDSPAPIPHFNNDEYEVIISETTLGNLTILNLTCSEPVGATGTSNLTTTLSESNDSRLFSLDGDYEDLMLVLLEEIDYEALSDTTAPHFTLTVTCSNQYEITTSATIEIEINNEDDNAFEFGNSTYSVVVPENVPRYYEVLHVSAFDPDIPDGIITYDAVNPNKFSVFPDGTVYVTDPPIDRETRDNYILNIEAKLRSNDETYVAGATVNLTISDLNESPPLFANDLYISDNLTTTNTVGDVALIVTAVDDDFANNGSVVYGIEENFLFAIDNTTGEIYIKNDSILSLYGSYVLEVYATDEGVPPMSSTSRVDIYVAPIPDRLVFHNFSSLLTVSEDAPRGYEIDKIIAEVVDRRNGTIVDAQTVGAVEYMLLENADSEIFHIGRFTGNLILLGSLDFETKISYELNVSVSIPNYSGSSVELTSTIEVLITDVNDNAPVFSPMFYAHIVEEFTEAGTSVLRVYAEDKDSGLNANVTYRLADGETVPFSVHRLTGIVEVSASLDTPLDYRFSVVAEDGGAPSQRSQAVVFISVVRSASVVPEFDRHRYTFNVTENAPRGTEIGTVLAQVAGNISIDEYTHLQYRLQMPDLDMMMMDLTLLFHIDSDSGAVSVLTELDAEMQDFYAVYVEVHNASNTLHVFDNATIEVYIEDYNDHAPEFKQSLYTEVITTAWQRNTILFNVSAEDGDKPGSVNSQIEYSLVEPDFIGFEIDGSTGGIFIVNSTLFVGDYHMTVIATDRGNPTKDGTALIFIAVIPAEPQEITFEASEYTFNVSEDATPGTEVGVIVAQNHNQIPFDDSTNVRYYFLNDSLISSVCLVIGEFSGVVQVSCTLNREREDSYTLVVFAEYEGNQTGEVRMTVNVFDINDNRPVFTKDVYAKVVFMTHGNTSPILQVTADDGDAGLNGLVHYSLADGMTGNTLFRIENETGYIYSVNELIPVGDYRLVVTASDSNPTMPETSTAVVFICVVHEEPTGPLQITTTSFEIDENNDPTGALVGTVKLQAGGIEIIPENYAGILKFSIGGEIDRFVINPNNGTLTAVGALDREEKSTYLVDVEAIFTFTESSGIYTSSPITSSSPITINIGDLNDNIPNFNPSSYAAVIDDNFGVNQTVPTGDIIATDRDVGTNAELEFSLEETNPFGVRSVNIFEGELRGQIFIRNTSLLEPGRSYLFNVIATDKGSSPQSASATVHIEVRYAIPETISFKFTEYSFNHTEHSDIGTRVGKVIVEQVTPALNDLVYSVSGGSGLYKFHIHQNTGEISNLVTLDREVDTEFSLTITAQLPHHTNLEPATTSVDITILDINDHIPIFDRSFYSTAVFADDITTYTPLITVSASDEDAGLNAAIMYFIISNGDDFRISENGSIFSNSDSLEVMTHSIMVEARDMGDVVQTGTTFVIIDVRNAIPDTIAFNQTQYLFTISEYDTPGTVVGQVKLDPPLAIEFLQYRSFSSDSSDFVVVTQSGVVQSLQQFDYESNEVMFIFEAMCILHLPHENPPVTLTASTSITVNIQDENDNTPQFVDFPSGLTHRENVIQDEMIADLSATDADSGTNADIRFEVLNDAMFRIDEITGELFVKPGLDREQEVVHTISVSVRDRGRPSRSFQSDITLTLLDINDNIPVLITSEFSVDERFTGNVFRLQYRDSDEGEFGRATFNKIVSGSDSRFAVDSVTGDVILTEGLDYESEAVVELLIELTDNPSDPGDSNTPRYTVTVNVINQPDNTPEFEQRDDEYSIAIDPGITSGDTLINVHATDEDAGDTITYKIESSTADFVNIFTDSGELYFADTDTLVPGTSYDIVVIATDNSVYELSASQTITVRVDARSLTFENDVYTGVVKEDAERGHSIQRVRIQELARSEDYQYTFTYEVKIPQDIEVDPFMPRTSAYYIDILVDDGLNRETVSSYVLEVTAERYLLSLPNKLETVKVELTITVEDVNDNAPVIATPDQLYSVSEDAEIDTEVAQVTATDRDIGTNQDLVYRIINPTGSPFKIDANGLITVKQQVLDYESQESYVLTVQVSDLGSPVLSSTAEYTVGILNVNDETPGFAALAYFGELYSGAPANSDIHHIVLEVTDRDGETEFTFSVSPDPTDVSASGYTLTISNQPHYHVMANTIPVDARSGLRKFSIEVSDGAHTNTTILYLGVFTEEHLLPVTISGKSKEEFETIVVGFLQSLSVEFSNILGQPVSYYYNSLEESSTDTTVLIMTIYGWYGDYGTRYDNGQEETRDFSNSVSYITYDAVNEDDLNKATAALSASTGINVAIGEVPVSTPTPDITQPPNNNTLLVGIAGGTTVAILLIVLLIVIIVVAGRRRTKPDKKDPYDLSYRGRHRRGKRPESIPLTPKAASSDLAYETMYDDDELLNQQQTMPWFDPNYLAPNETEGYDGDIEQSSSKRAPNALRATVDGDAKKNRRHSSDESAGGDSVTALDPSRYLGSYQRSTPMQPGQKMGEYDMFLNPNAREADKPRRPALSVVSGSRHAQRRGTTA